MPRAIGIDRIRHGVRAVHCAFVDESLAEQREANRKTVQAFLTDPRRFTDTEFGSRLSLSLSEFEWLLQILNDVRADQFLEVREPERS